MNYGKVLQMIYSNISEKFERAQLSHHNKLMELSDVKDQEFNDKHKRLKEKIRTLELECTRFEEVTSSNFKFLG